MRWEGNRESGNVEDHRGGGGGGGGFRVGGGGLSIGAVVIAIVGGAVFGINPLTILAVLSGGGGAPVVQQAPQQPPADDRTAKFVSTVLADTEDVWKQVFSNGGAAYREPKLALFTGGIRTACGAGQSAMGPFYCPADQKIYIDLDFWRTLGTKLGAPGEFAQAYVIAHEVGHHVQHQLGITQRVEQARARGSEQQANAMSVRLELQADCFAGVWAHWSQQGKQWLDPGDIEAAMNAASRIGDDTLQRSAGRAVVPESFTHGSSAQRQRWFANGWKTGSVKSCDTFSAASL
jgi:predicted metalloprotease